MNIFRDPRITARVRRGREPSNMEIYEWFDDLSLTDTIKEKINHLANAYKCIGEDHYSIRRDLFNLSSKRAAKITPSVEQYEDEDESVKLAYKTIYEYIHNNNWEMFQEQYMAPILESECDEKIINENLYTKFKKRLAPHLSQRLEGIEYSDKQPYISGAKLEIIFETEELQNLLILSDYLFKKESRKVINDLKEQMYKIKNKLISMG